MSELRLWVHHQIARLDRTSERRFVALAAALIFAVLAVGPQALRVVDAQVNAPDIRIDEIGANPVSNPVRFRATTLNVQLGNLDFLVKMPDGSTLPLPGQRSSTDPSVWNSPDFVGEPGQAYEVKSRGFSPTTGTAVESSQPVVFSIFDPNSGGTSAPPPTGSTGQTTPKTVVLQQLVAFPGLEPKIEASGRHDGFTADSAFFRIRSLSGLAFLGERDAALENGTWHGIYAVPGGSLYQVTLVAREGATLRESDPLTVAVPVAETPPAAPDPTQPPPPPPAAISLLLPDAGATLASPVTFAARVANASATSVIFEVLDPAGVTRQVTGQPGATGGWSAMFFGEAGQYRVGARASLSDGSIITAADSRSFGILAAATNVEPPPTTTAPPPEPAPLPPAEEPAAAPFIELFSPAADAPPFGGAVPITARVRNGLPDRVVAVVIAPSGAETVVIASKSATGDFWNALFEGPDGEYRFRVRAQVAGVEIFSSDRRFAIKRPATALPPPPTAPAPAPTTTTGTTATSSPLPPPPPPPTGTVPPPAPPAEPAPTGAVEDSQAAPVPAAAPVPETLALECRQAGIAPERCAEWLKAKYQSRECLEAGAFTREACAALLGRLNIAPDESKLMGLPPLSAITQAREDAGKILAAPVRREDLPPSISALLPVERDQRAFVRVLEVANPGESSSPALIVLDTDGDGLPNDVERRFGTDPEAPDTDGDGFSDGEEVKNGYNPLGAGTLERPVRGVERALIEGRAIEEPRGADAAADPSFTIASAEPVPEAEAEGEDVIRLSGTAAPNSVVTIFVYSYLPVVVTTTTDENGNWTYDFGSKLAEGRHEAYVSVNDETGKLVAASSPLAFFVREAQAVSEEEFLRPDVNVEEAPATLSRWFIYGGIGLVALALALVFAIVRQVRKDPMPGSGEGL